MTLTPASISPPLYLPLPPPPPSRSSTPSNCLECSSVPLCSIHGSEPRNSSRNCDTVAKSIIRARSAPPTLHVRRSVSPPSERGGDPRTWGEYLSSGLWNSQNPKDIGWKIARYQSILNQLRQFCIPLHDLLVEIQSDEPTMLALDRLYNVLVEVDLSITAMDAFTRVYLDTLRKTFSELFVADLRVILENFDRIPTKEIQEFIRSLSQYLFTHINLHEECLDLVRAFDASGSILKQRPPVYDDIFIGDVSLVHHLHTLYEHFHEVPYSAKRPIHHGIASSIQGISGFGFDPLTQSNLPHVLGHVGVCRGDDRSSQIAILGLGSPTIQDKPDAGGVVSALLETTAAKAQKAFCFLNPWSASSSSDKIVPVSEAAKAATKIDPIFVSWMESYRSQEKSHLYVVNQDYTGKYSRLEGDERPRIEVILATAAEERFSDTFYAVVLSKNSPFFNQNYNDIDEEYFSISKSFISELYRQFFEICPALSGNFIPSKIFEKIPDLPSFSLKMINAIHRVVFDGKTRLTKEERVVFIDLFQDLFICRLMIGLGVSSINVSCKDAIDRAADSMARLWAHLMLVSDLENLQKFREIYISILMARALMVRKRPILHDRLLRNILSVGTFEEKKQQIKDLWGELFPGVKLVPVNQTNV